MHPALILVQQAVETVDSGLPDTFAYMAVGWAVTVTSAVAGLVLNGKLVLGRELTFMTVLYEKEKADKELLVKAGEATIAEVRLQNQTLSTTVEVLRKTIEEGVQKKDQP
jgi:hypothetical protein